MHLFDLTGEVAAVLGGTGVLGGGLADGIARAGSAVGVLGRNTERGEARANTIRDEGGKGMFVSADALDRSSLAQARRLIEERFGPVSVLINAAGGNNPKVIVTPER